MQNRLLFDKRLVQQNFRRGRLTHAEWEAHLESLPDVSEKATSFELKSPQEEALAAKEQQEG